MSNHDDDLPVDEPVNSEQPSKLRQKLAERKAQREAQEREAAEATSSTSHEEDLVPEIQYERTDEDKEVDEILENIDIVDAYKRWCGKMVPKVGNKREGIMISCPIPGHMDERPSAWINLDKQTWFCGGCDEGGDAYDIAAYRLGYPVPDYKNGSQFHKLRRDMAAEFGLTIHKTPGGHTIVSAPEPVTEPEPKPEDEAKVISLHEADEDDDDEIVLPTLDWRKVVPEGTFLDEYMKAVCVDDVPEEYHFWHGLLALGFALGRDVTLFDSSPVYSNLFVCTVGRSGIGKSKARRHLDELLQRALPHDWNDPNSKGVRRISAPGSAESLIFNFQKPVADPSNPKVIMYNAPVRGLIDFNELSSLVARTGRMGSVLQPTLLQFYDMEHKISTSSMTHGTKEAELPFASTLTTTQPRSLRMLVNQNDDASGFLNRWIFAGGKEKTRFAVGGVTIDVEPSVNPLMDISGWAASFSSGEQITWSEKALARFSQFFHDRIEPDKKRARNDLIVRIDLLLKKLILLFSANQKQREAQVDAVESAIGCYDYLLSCYGVTGEQLGTSKAIEVQEAILGFAERSIKNNGVGPSPGEVRKHLNKRNKYEVKLINETLKNLVELGLLIEERPSTGRPGRPTVRYRYVG